MTDATRYTAMKSIAPDDIDLQYADLGQPWVSGCALSKYKLYRYCLWRTWSTIPGDVVLWIMLNPSVADAVQPDNTVTLCCGYADRWGFGGIEVVNAFAYRSTNPKKLLTVKDPIGSHNDAFIVQRAKACQLVVAGWGTGGALLGRDQKVLRMLRDVGVAVHCLKTTKDGHPVHPLRQLASLQPQRFEGGVDDG